MLGVGEVKEDEPHWTEVLTDVLLGFLTQPSQLWRTLSKQTYRHFIPHLSEEALHLVIKVYKLFQLVLVLAIVSVTKGVWVTDYITTLGLTFLAPIMKRPY